MTNSFSKPGDNKKQWRKHVVPPISLDRPEAKQLTRGQYQTYKLRNVPQDNDSATYELSVPYFSTGTVEEWLRFRSNLTKVLHGQRATQGTQQYVIGRRLLEGAALTTFQNCADAQTSETVANFTECMNAVARSIFPRDAARNQKRYMRRFLRKPATMLTRDFVSRVIEINNYFPSFPQIEAENGVLTDVEKLPNDELLDIFAFGVPNSWQKAMTLQDFDPPSHTLQEFISFCERMEQIENHEKPEGSSAKASKKNKKKSSSSEDKDSSSKKRGRDDGPKNCLLHGDDCGHETHRCHALKAQAKRMKQTYEAQAPEKKKEYKRKQELNSMIAAAVEQAMSKKKRKRKSSNQEMHVSEFENLSVSDSSHSDGESSSSSASSDSS